MILALAWALSSVSSALDLSGVVAVAVDKIGVSPAILPAFIFWQEQSCHLQQEAHGGTTAPADAKSKILSATHGLNRPGSCSCSSRRRTSSRPLLTYF